MTSKSLYFSLLKEDMRRRVWAMALSILGFVCFIPLNLMLGMERLKGLVETEGIERVITYVNGYANTDAAIILFITVGVALLSAFSGYMYLYAKDKVDLYHSIPVKREKLFVTTYINGILIYIIPYAVNLVMYFIIAASNGVMNGDTISGSLIALFINSIGFLLVYNVIIAAIMLTGNLLTGIMATGVFMSFVPIVGAIIDTMGESFFSTYSYYGTIGERIAGFSPLFAYYNMINSYNLGEATFKRFLIIIIFIILIFSAGLVLYKKRPSEAAGRAMAFKSSELPVKATIVLAASLMGGFIFMSMSYTNGFEWFIFGLIFIGALTHAIIEIMYTADFRSAIIHKLQFVIIMVISLVIVLTIKLDIFGYDNYLPKEDSVDYMAVSVGNVDNYMYFYERINHNSSYESYVNSTDFCMDNMKLENKDTAYKLAEYTVANDLGDVFDNNRRIINLYIKYVLNSGREVYREYRVYEDEAREYISDIYADSQYKEGAVPLVKMDKAGFKLVEYTDAYTGELLSLTKNTDDIIKLLEYYCEDIINLKYEEAISQAPVSQLMISTSADRRNGNTYNYYIYESFNNTIEYMKSLGADIKSGFDVDKIESISIMMEKEYSDSYNDYNNYDNYYSTREGVVSGEWTEHVFKDKADIEKICNALVYNEITYNLPRLYSQNAVTINYKENTGISPTQKNGFTIIIDKLDQSIKDELGIK